MSEGSVQERSRREALRWMIALRERPDDTALHQRFEDWRRLAVNDAAWQDLDRVDTLIRRATEASDPISPHPRTDCRPRRAGWKSMAPAVLAACTIGLLIGGDILLSVGADLATGSGEMRTMRLADGSHITLAPRSAIAIDRSTNGRQVRLLRGTAFFDVVHDEGRPFRVSAGQAVATDLGTAFDVRREGGAATIAVREGLVRASCDVGWSDPDVLRPGETQQLDCAAGRQRRDRVAPTAVASWTAGRLVVVDRPLREVVAALRPWQHGLLFARGEGMNRRVTGVYDLRDPDRAMAAIARAHGTTVVTISPWIRVVSAD